MKKTLLVSMVLALVALGASFLMWGQIPANMPTHWGFDGRPDGFMPKQIGLLLFPGLVFAIPLLVVGLLWLDPRRRNVEQSNAAIAWIVNGLSVFLLTLHLLTLRAATLPKMELSGGMVLALVGGLFVLIGLMLPRVKSNWFVGVRTPWTLSSEEVWARTHRVGGWCMVIGGLVVIPAALWLPQQVGIVVSVVVMALSGLAPVVLSFIYYRQEQQAQ